MSSPPQITGKVASLDVRQGNCDFTLMLYERAKGGVEVFLSVRHSLYEALPLEQITWLRQQGGDLKQIHIASLDSDFRSPMTRLEAVSKARDWFFRHLRLEYSWKDRAMTLLDRVAAVLRWSPGPDS